MARVRACNSNRSPQYSPNLIENRSPGHVLSNNGLCLQAAVQYVLLFLALAVNSDWFQISELHAVTPAARSYEHTFKDVILYACGGHYIF